jgi:hypothetical protein
MGCKPLGFHMLCEGGWIEQRKGIDGRDLPVRRYYLKSKTGAQTSAEQKPVRSIYNKTKNPKIQQQTANCKKFFFSFSFFLILIQNRFGPLL